jgi:uncharacterized membrane protein
MSTIEQSVEVAVPVRTAYDQWTQFEEFPRFMDGVKAVEQLDDTHVRWKAKVAGRRKRWDAEIIEQVPDQRIAWRSTSGARNAGLVTFQPAGTDRTRVTLRMDVEPDDAVERVGDAIGILDRQVHGDLQRFKEFIEERRVATGAWRGTVQDGIETTEDPRRHP